MVVVPYLLVAPLLFAPNPKQRITLGTLVQTSNSFDKVCVQGGERAEERSLSTHSLER